ncbi:flagellin [Guyparkeria hydrothermalis]|nr:flagellin [Guyparkeria hydrothermalis]
MALNAQRQLGSTQNEMQTAMERLSSGLRINSAADDAAGLAIADRMTSQIRGLNQAVRNANDGISLSQTAEGAMQESSNILQRMRELAIQSANDSNSDTDRANLQKEVSQLQQELNRISETTTFNGKNILDGSFTSSKFQVGSNANETINVSIGSTSALDMGAYQQGTQTNIGGLAVAQDISGGNGVAGGDLTINGASGTGTYTVGDGVSAKTIAEGVNGLTGSTGVSATASTEVTVGSLSAAGTVTFDLSSSNGESAVTISTGIADTSDLSNLASAINDRTAQTGITATLSADKASIELANDKGEDINIENFVHSGDNGETLDVGSVSLTGPSGGTVAASPAGDSVVVGGQVEFESSGSFSVASAVAAGTENVLTATGGATTIAGSLSSVAQVDISSRSGSNDAISVIDKALSFISEERASLGAVQNRLESTISNLQNVSENVSAARSQIQDADFAKETSNLSRSQILQQAGTAMLSQANAAQQNVLSLLG